MITLNEFKKNFAGYETTSELINLKYFEQKHPFFSESFYLITDDKSLLKTWSTDQLFLDSFMPFAQANGTGSVYAIWDNDSSNLLNELPIVVIGDEGGAHIVAENIFELMQLLTFDSEIMVDHDEAFFYKDDADYEENENNMAYRDWLQENYDLAPTNNPNKIIANAQKSFKQSFDEWFNSYGNE